MRTERFRHQTLEAMRFIDEAIVHGLRAEADVRILPRVAPAHRLIDLQPVLRNLVPIGAQRPGDGIDVLRAANIRRLLARDAPVVDIDETRCRDEPIARIPPIAGAILVRLFPIRDMKRHLAWADEHARTDVDPAGFEKTGIKMIQRGKPRHESLLPAQIRTTAKPGYDEGSTRDDENDARNDKNARKHDWNKRDERIHPHSSF
ncbi:hypothetical protein [Slackia exigua]|uniref:hypothetical protein n=1 Tax=Slackia exigua TaxID=84109 RepID=UPI00254CFE2E|nr:hypothetical protein [Slackia exigua]